MRHLVYLLSCSVLLSAAAQTDMNQMIQERMAASGVKMEDDTSPYVPNEFVGSFRMEMHMFDGATEQKNSPRNMRYWSAEDKTLNKMEMPEEKGRDMRIMTDLKNKFQYTLMTDEEGKKMAMKSKKKKVTMTEEKPTKEPEITVTNETKTIEGHLCTKAIVKTEDGTWTGWVAKDVKAPFSDMARNVGGRSDDKMMKSFKGMPGFPLEFEWVNAKDGGRMVCYMKELKVGAVDESVFSLDGYEVMEMPSFGQ
jgi:GLPGLI family protein